MLSPEIMKELRYVEVYTAKRMRNIRLGTFTSRIRGAGFDFDEHRLYRPGDDVRRIDWNVTARLNMPFVRETHADRELNVVIALDLSRSMRFGAEVRSKKDVMLYIAACLVFSALADQVNIGFLAFSDRVIMYSPPRRTRARVWSMLEELWTLDVPASPTAIVPAVRYLAGHLKKLSTIFLVSDFITEENLQQAKDLKVLAATHDVVGVVVEDPREAELPAGSSAIRVRDLESGRAVRVGLSEGLRRRYRELVGTRHAQLSDMFYGVPMDHVFVRSDRSAIEPLLRLFAERRRP
jgi:uncharacterized protein (DUF58 family)